MAAGRVMTPAAVASRVSGPRRSPQPYSTTLTAAPLSNQHHHLCLPLPAASCSFPASLRLECHAIRGAGLSGQYSSALGDSLRCGRIVCGVGRRESLGGLALSTFILPQLPAEKSPVVGDCPTCVGGVNDTLGTCGSSRACRSSYDDRPAYFYNPWEFECEGGAEEAMERIMRECLSLGGQVQMQTGIKYLWVSFATQGPLNLVSTDDVEFLIPTGDNTVSLRAASRTAELPDAGRIAKRLDDIRRRLGWDEVFILRNRQRRFLVVESPWDDFGPPPPPSLDYRLDLEE